MLLGLVILMGFITAIVTHDSLSWGIPESEAELAPIGTWVGAQGNSLELRPDGSAIGRQEGCSSIGVYRWKVENDVLSMEDCPLKPGPTWIARKFIDDIMNASRRVDYNLTKLGRDSLILEELQSERVLEFERMKHVNN